MLLFDGESGLRSKKAQNIIADKFNIKVHAEAFYKRNMAERAIREIKLRMAVLLDLEKKPLTQWRNYLEQVLQIINQNKKQYKSVMQMLADFFTKETVNLPQTSDQIYKFNIGDKVSIDAFPNQRRNLGFKYSLNMGKFFYPTTPHLQYPGNLFSLDRQTSTQRHCHCKKPPGGNTPKYYYSHLHCCYSLIGSGVTLIRLFFHAPNIL